MKIASDVDLRLHSTMRLGGHTAYSADVTKKEDIPELIAWAEERKLPIIMIGLGSNIIWKDEGFNGLLLVNKITGRKIIRDDSSGVLVELGAGNVWDDDVAWTVEQGLSGIESLSLVPGTTGATPVQNVGAYGSEISKTLVEVSAYDTADKNFVTIAGSECNFSYRSSKFKTSDKGHYLITGVKLLLKRENPTPPFYESLQKYFAEHGIQEYTPRAVREAVIAIRSAKLPDPAKIANNGSFFTNPIIGGFQYDKLKSEHPDIKAWPQKDGTVKLAAGWLVEKAGFLDAHDEQTGMATWPKQALVLVNEHATKTADLLAFKAKIVGAVSTMFGVTLIQEPEILP